MLFSLTNYDHVVQGNFIGTDITGTKALGNALNGVRLENAVHIRIGGTENGAGNLISVKGQDGVSLFASLSRLLVEGNWIGTDLAGSRASGNLGDGVHLHGVISLASNDSKIGGTAPGADNLISGNCGNSIAYVNDAKGIAIAGSRIGTDLGDGSALGNALNGVSIQGFDNLVCGTTPGAGNTIAYNAERGVLVVGHNNGALGNAIVTNGLLGIDLIGNGVIPERLTDPPDPGYAHTAATLLAEASRSGAGTTVTGTLANELPIKIFRVEFFANPVADPTGFGQGRTFLGAADVTTDGGGNVSFTFTMPVAVPGGEFVAATATDPRNDTSEFSRAVKVIGSVEAPAVTDPASIPRVVALRASRLGSTRRLILDFSNPLNADSARDLAQYRLISLGRDRRLGTSDDHDVPLVRAAYKPLAHRVVLRLPRGL